MITVIDDFLSGRHFHDIGTVIGERVFSNWDNLPLYWSPYVSDKENDGVSTGYFTHLLYNKNPEDCDSNVISSEFHWIADMIYDRYLKLDSSVVDDCNIISRAKINFFTSTETMQEFGFHQDMPRLRHNSVIFYLHDCNGYTLFDDGTRIRTKANRAVIITNGLKYRHASTNSTDYGYRAVVNIVLKPKG